MKSYKNVDEYIKKSDKAHKALLEEVRAIIIKTAPKAIEEIAYGMPAYKLEGEPLFYFAAMKGHLGLYPTPGPILVLKSELENFSTSKGCVRVPYGAKLPKSLIVKLIKERIKQIKNLK
jgi:uncharacterized protein YdhG (YjbR/CyaY superfamily)